MGSMRMAGGQRSRSEMMWTKHLPAAVAATGLASLHGGKGHLLVLITSLFGLGLTAAARLRGGWCGGANHRARPEKIRTPLLRVPATSTESERAQSLLDNSGDKVGHFLFI
jgi:hypothetical protein